ncbi:transglycosylase domain-containing protein [Helicobacter sp. 23-1044]
MMFALFTIVAIYDTQSKVAQVVNYTPNKALKILDRKDRLVANAFEDEFRHFVPYDEIPPKIIETLLAVEDTMFFEHSGINLDAIMRAMLRNLKSGGLNEGGSTISQQLVKNIALSMERTFDRKFKEAIITIQIEKFLSKEEILEKYLNCIFFGNGFYGIKTAADGYFNKDLQNLTLKEIAMLMALPKAPSFYNPVTNLKASLTRANTILERLYNIGWITKDEFENALNEVPKVYNKTLTQNLAPYVVDEVLRQLSHIKDLKTGGYVVKTHIDLDYQKVAQTALKNGYDNIISRTKKVKNAESNENSADSAEETDDTLNGAIVVTQSKTGNILALVGGVDYSKSPFNRATQAKRQFGSTVKPFIYQIALDMGYSQGTQISDVARSFGQNEADLSNADLKTEETIENDAEAADNSWRPKNYSRSYNGIVTLKEALRRSLNLATINLVDMIGFRAVYGKMVDYGFANIPQDMTVVLGSFALSPLDVAKQYSLFANYGTPLNPKLIREIIKPDGSEMPLEIAESSAKIAESTKKFGEKSADSALDSAPKELLAKEQAYLSIDILKSVVTHGTGYRARTSGIEIAGKTGTSNDSVDAWFSGFSPTLQVVVWYGRDDNKSIGNNLTGGVISAPVAGEFFRNILRVEPGLKRAFDVPSGIFRRNIDGVEYLYTKTSKLPAKSNVDGEILF